MIVGIDGSRYKTNTPTGVEMYSYFLLNELIPLFTDDIVRIYTKQSLPANTKLLQPQNVHQKVIKFNHLWTLLHLSNEIWSYQPDIFYTPSHVFPFVKGKRNVITIHDVIYKHFPQAYNFKARTYLDFQTKRSVEIADRIIVPSIATANDLIDFYKCPSNKISVISHGPPTENLSKKKLTKEKQIAQQQLTGVKKGMQYFLYIGRLEHKKNLIRTIEAFERFIINNDSKYYLVIAGSKGYGASEILNKIKSSKVKEKIIVLGYISEETKHYLYKNAFCSVLATLSEGFGFPILESYKYGIPMITSRNSACEEVAGNGSILVNPMDIGSIFDGMVKVKDLKTREYLINEGKKQAKLFSWKNTAKKTYNAILG